MNAKKTESRVKPVTKQTKIQNGVGDKKEGNYDRIKALVEKTAAMQIIAEERHKTADKYFAHLRKKLHVSGTFLKNAKQDIENIKFLFQRDHISNMETKYSLDNIDKSDEEMEEEIKAVQQKLNNLQTRLHNLKTKAKNETQTLEEAISKTITSLDNASKGVYGDGSNK